MKRKRSQEEDKGNANVVSKSKTMSFRKSAPMHTRYMSKEDMEGQTIFYL